MTYEIEDKSMFDSTEMEANFKDFIETLSELGVHQSFQVKGKVNSRMRVAIQVVSHLMDRKFITRQDVAGYKRVGRVE